MRLPPRADAKGCTPEEWEAGWKTLPAKIRPPKGSDGRTIQLWITDNLTEAQDEDLTAEEFRDTVLTLMRHPDERVVLHALHGEARNFFRNHMNTLYPNDNRDRMASGPGHPYESSLLEESQARDIGVQAWKAVCESASNAREKEGEAINPVMALLAGVVIGTAGRTVVERELRRRMDGARDGDYFGAGVLKAIADFLAWARQEKDPVVLARRWILDPGGRLAQMSLKVTPLVANLANLPHFQILIDGPDSGVILENPALGVEVRDELIRTMTERVDGHGDDTSAAFFRALRATGYRMEPEQIRALQTAVVRAPSLTRALHTVSEIPEAAQDPALRQMMAVHGSSMAVARTIARVSGKDWAEVVVLAAARQPEPTLKDILLRSIKDAHSRPWIKEIKREDVFALAGNVDAEIRSEGLRLINAIGPDKPARTLRQ